ncbi:MAG: hypothetical protein K5705_12960 [Oscillospiraceae bacterium]|nr:hypothetical protein [Oscillospiraceae bacterium]
MSYPGRPDPGSAGKKQTKQQKEKNQKKQLIMMAGTMVVCAVLLTWTILLLKDRLSNDTNEQSSQFRVLEESASVETTATVTTLPSEITEPVSTSVTTATGTELTVSTSLTNATAPPQKKLVTQKAVFIKATTTRPVHTTKRPAATTRGAAPPVSQKTTARTSAHATSKTAVQSTTTHTQTVTQTTAPPKPSGQTPAGTQVLYNQLLAAYLGAGAQGGSAYYYKAAGTGRPTVVLSGKNGADAVIKGGQGLVTKHLGGTGNADENPWQTGSAFTFKRLESGSEFIYYVSEGNNHKVIGYMNPADGDNVWARISYTEQEGAWSAEYAIFRNSTSNPLQTGTCAVDGLYGAVSEMETPMSTALQGAGIPAGDPSLYQDVSPNAQNDISALREQAGKYNDGFTLPAGSKYGVVCTDSSAVNLRAGMSTASGVVAVVPAGTFLCVDGSFEPGKADWCPVTLNMDGTWYSGYISAELVLTWSAD